tara:strand:+ start:944 stop:1381 length:438 start_codon:yes stop_codon:yes gene_type:complete
MDQNKKLNKDNNERHIKMIAFVKSQTDYDEKTIEEKLKKWNNNYMHVIKEYLNPNFNPNEVKAVVKKTVNQKVFSEMRNFMDDVHSQYKQRKKQKEMYEMYLQKMHAIQAKKQRDEKERLSTVVEVKEITDEDEDSDEDLPRLEE